MRLHTERKTRRMPVCTIRDVFRILSSERGEEAISACSPPTLPGSKGHRLFLVRRFFKIGFRTGLAPNT